MLVIISDLHLQQTNLDSLRYRRDGVVRQTGVHRNVKAGAFDRLFDQIDKAAKRHAAREVHLVFAGDIFELHRTPLWFTGAANEVRPVDVPGPDRDSNALRNRIGAILDGLEEEHASVWQRIQQFAAPTAAGAPVRQLHYLPGNHDRLANAWPSVRRRIRQLLGMPVEEGPFPVRLDFAAGPTGYGVRIRHGHEYDPSNFARSTEKKTALDLGWKDYLEPAFGDYITVDVATRLALAFRVRYAAAMRGSRGDELRQLYLALHEFDDVRPASLLVDYLVQQMGVHRKSTFEILRPILRDTLETAVATPFFTRHARRHVPAILLKLLPELLKNLSATTIEEVIRRVARDAKGGSNPPAGRARGEFEPNSPFDLIVGGHTHAPEQVPLPPRPDGSPVFYLNSGTWRTTLPAGIESFGRLRAYTFLCCYNPVEQAAPEADGRRFEAWTGHLSEGTIGPYDEPADEVSAATAGDRQLRFTRLEVLEVQKELRGAELDVRLGVDDHPRRLEWKKVRPGVTLPIDLPAIPLDPALDGDVWCYGDEVDLGSFILNRDDPLPWGFGRLEREAPRGQFASGSNFLNMRDRRTHLRLHYEVEPAGT